mmetsp:Transcript_1968/g.3449  ORF Transcript_1968/g.3449 Transcript_1968/m.3449 type:complete len:383 (-) Transcript_1968:230-1378(-)
MFDLFRRFDFNAAGRGLFFQSLIQFSVFLDNQFSRTVPNNALLRDVFKVVQEAETPAKEKLKFKKIVNCYLSFCCLYGYHKNVSEKLEIEELNNFLPNQEALKPKFLFVNPKFKYIDADEGDDYFDDRLVTDESRVQLKQIYGFTDQQLDVHTEVRIILRAFQNKVFDVVESIRKALEDPEEQAKISTDQRYQLFLEIMLMKFANKSLEHVTKGFEKIRPILEAQYQGNRQAQSSALDIIFNAYQISDIGEQCFERENLFMLRQKVVQLVERLCDLPIFDELIVIELCLQQLDAHSFEVNQDNTLDLVQSQLIFTLVDKVQSERSHLAARYIQEHDKTAEKKVETPHEKFQREKREQAALESGDPVKKEESKEKTPEEVAEE